jgi:hypothetical protein
MPRFRGGLPPGFQRRMVELARSGRTPEELSREFEPTAQLIMNWPVRLSAMPVGGPMDLRPLSARS